MSDAGPVSFAREVWTRIETIHAVTYFAPESIEAAKSAGLRGFWMGYFGCRAAPLGPVGPGVVEAVFANFERSMVCRSIPDAWSYADPATLLVARARAAADVLRRCSPAIEEAALGLVPQLESVVGACDSIGRPLFAANRDLAVADDPVERLWQACTSLREHRGDGHVAVLTGVGVDGCEAHALMAARQGVDPAVFYQHRGWSDEQQTAAATRLTDRGLVADGMLTSRGRQLCDEIEETTDALASAPFDRAGLDGAPGGEALLRGLTAIASDVVRADVVPFPNPMGLPRLDI